MELQDLSAKGMILFGLIMRGYIVRRIRHRRGLAHTRDLAHLADIDAVQPVSEREYKQVCADKFKYSENLHFSEKVKWQNI